MKFNKGLDFEKLYRIYFEEHLQDFIKSYIDYYIEFDEVGVQEIMEDNKFTTLKEVRNYLYNNYNEDDIYEANSDYIEKEVNKNLQIIYDESFEKVKDTTKNIVNNFSNLLNDIYFNYDIKNSRSWHKTNFPSIYFIVTLKKEDIIEELIIRLSDLHDNNRNDSDIELNWYDLDINSYKEDLVDKLCECLESNFDIEDTIEIYHKLCDSRKENKMIRKIRDINMTSEDYIIEYFDKEHLNWGYGIEGGFQFNSLDDFKQAEEIVCWLVGEDYWLDKQKLVIYLEDKDLNLRDSLTIKERKIRDTGRADTLEETIKAIANKQYKKYSPLHLNLSQKQLDILISNITYSDDLVKLVNKFVRKID